jgi:hypothetical protein
MRGCGPTGACRLRFNDKKPIVVFYMYIFFIWPPLAAIANLLITQRDYFALLLEAMMP